MSCGCRVCREQRALRMRGGKFLSNRNYFSKTLKTAGCEDFKWEVQVVGVGVECDHGSFSSEGFFDVFGNGRIATGLLLSLRNCAGVKFSCRHCGKEGHRRHFCPKLGYVKKSRSYPTRVYRCGLCQQVGHTRRHCPLKDSVQASDPTSLIRRYKPRAKGVKRGTYKCGHCHQTGHSRRTCPKLVKKGVEDAEGWRIGKMNRCKGKRLAI